MLKMLRRFWLDQSGATAIEYGLIAAMMAVAVIACLVAFGPELLATYQSTGTQMDRSGMNITAGG